MKMKFVLTLADAKRVAAAAAEEAKRNDWSVVIAIVDDAGLPVYLERLDGVQPASCDIAQHKARAAALFRRPTKALEETVAGGRVALLSRPSGLLAAAKRPARDADGFWRNAVFARKFKQQGFVSGEMVEDRQMKAAFAEKLRNVAALNAREREKPHQPLFLAGKIAEREQGHLFRQFGQIFTIPGAFH